MQQSCVLLCFLSSVVASSVWSSAFRVQEEASRAGYSTLIEDSRSMFWREIPQGCQVVFESTKVWNLLIVENTCFP